jgi:gas vesicle protein
VRVPSSLVKKQTAKSGKGGRRASIKKNRGAKKAKQTREEVAAPTADDEKHSQDIKNMESLAKNSRKGRKGKGGLNLFEAQDELNVIGGKNKPGKLVDINEAKAENGAVITVHGINGSPGGHVQHLHKQADSEGKQVKSFAYDDRNRNLTDTSKDLAKELSDWLEQNPGKPLRVQAHSQGSRPALVAIDELHKAGKLKGQDVSLDLIAPIVAGTELANGAGLISGGVKSLTSSNDNATYSKFQDRIESVKLPDSVKTRIFVGDQDAWINHDGERFNRIAENNNAEVHYLKDTDHTNVVEKVANGELGSKEKIPQQKQLKLGLAKNLEGADVAALSGLTSTAIAQFAATGKLDSETLLKGSAAAAGGKVAANVLRDQLKLGTNGSALTASAVSSGAQAIIGQLVANGKIDAKTAATAVSSQALSSAAQNAAAKQLGVSAATNAGVSAAGSAVAGVGGAVASVVTQLAQDGKLDAEQTTVAVASAVASYAAAGAVAGPVGVVIGAAVGAAVTLLATKEGRKAYKDLKKYQFELDKDLAKSVHKTLLEPTPKNLGKTAKKFVSRPKKRFKKLKSIFGGPRRKRTSLLSKAQKAAVCVLRKVGF